MQIRDASNATRITGAFGFRRVASFSEVTVGVDKADKGKALTLSAERI